MLRQQGVELITLLAFQLYFHQLTSCAENHADADALVLSHSDSETKSVTYKNRNEAHTDLLRNSSNLIRKDELL